MHPFLAILLWESQVVLKDFLEGIIMSSQEPEPKVEGKWKIVWLFLLIAFAAICIDARFHTKENSANACGIVATFPAFGWLWSVRNETPRAHGE